MRSAVVPAKAGTHNPDWWLWVPALAALGRDDSRADLHPDGLGSAGRAAHASPITTFDNCCASDKARGSNGGGSALFRPVEYLLRPKSIAIIGASDSSRGGWAQEIYANLEHCGFPAKLYL